VQWFGRSALRAGGSHGPGARYFYHGRTISQAAAALRARGRVKAEQENKLTTLVKYERAIREREKEKRDIRPSRWGCVRPGATGLGTLRSLRD
jgi:hypothetical protein